MKKRPLLFYIVCIAVVTMSLIVCGIRDAYALKEKKSNNIKLSGDVEADFYKCDDYWPKSDYINCWMKFSKKYPDMFESYAYIGYYLALKKQDWREAYKYIKKAHSLMPIKKQLTKAGVDAYCTMYIGLGRVDELSYSFNNAINSYKVARDSGLCDEMKKDIDGLIIRAISSKYMPGPHNNWAREVKVITNPPGANIELDGNYLGKSPLSITIHSQSDTFYRDAVIKAFPTHYGDCSQIKRYPYGQKIPQKIFFEMGLCPVAPSLDVNIR